MVDCSFPLQRIPSQIQLWRSFVFVVLNCVWICQRIVSSKSVGLCCPQSFVLQAILVLFMYDNLVLCLETFILSVFTLEFIKIIILFSYTVKRELYQSFFIMSTNRKGKVSIDLSFLLLRGFSLHLTLAKSNTRRITGI